ncbi:MAG: molybdopterin-guanine dinucleotide biosynthesis protein B [Thermoanaerobaculia bacterium]
MENRERTRPGIDGLLADPSPVAGRRIGLITNPSGVTAAGVPTWKVLFESRDVELARLFGPEHGIDGGAAYMEAVGGQTHAPTGLPVVSLYGRSVESLKPGPEDLEGLDALIFDVADVGARYYTFAWTMLLAMEACAESGLSFVVCDRPNPIGGAAEGAPQEPEYLSFVGLHPIAVRHGMTAGELGRLLAAERRIGVDLHVVPMRGWARETPFEATGLPWVSPSPNIPAPRAALAYPGICLLEGTNLSEGRGTTRPFELFGAPYLSAVPFAEALNSLELPGAAFLPTHFRPMFDKHAGVTCAGALLHVTDPGAFRSFEMGLRVVETAKRLAPRDFRWRAEPYEFDARPAIDLLTGSSRFRQMLDAGAGLAPEIARHDAGARDFLAHRAPYLLYPDRKPAVVAFVGAHNAGKTTLIVDLLPRLRALGLSVGTIKHTSRDAEDDVPGKDSHRHAAAGARVASFVTPERTTARRFGSEEAIDLLLSREFEGCDLVLVEGYKSLPLPKIEVRRAAVPGLPIEGASARVCDEPGRDSIPTLRFEDREGIVKTVLRLAGLSRQS